MARQKIEQVPGPPTVGSSHSHHHGPRCAIFPEGAARPSGDGGRDESKRQRAESQWIVAARPLCHLQYSVAYLSRLQRILPIARWELRSKEAPATFSPRSLHLRHMPLGAKGPYCGSAIGRRARAPLLAQILT
ncbi:hypothetical protein GOBAR_AA36888 [Gossypium barbadense]|uniref:Uncharacterized protein n=1 Tax=Gossypium barbadense TaxID=3634 RepID=A0A2P5VYD6_GOSBA|nr:hypothetical protein GOBAR_AA36888 [Gossypium barbadense]